MKQDMKSKVGEERERERESTRSPVRVSDLAPMTGDWNFYIKLGGWIIEKAKRVMEYTRVILTVGKARNWPLLVGIF